MTHILTANSPIIDMVLNSLLKELMRTKVAKKSYKHKYQQVKASLASTAATPVTIGDATVNYLTPAITTATETTVLKELMTTPGPRT